MALPGQVFTQPGSFFELFASRQEKVDLAMQDPKDDPVWGPLSFLGNEMKDTGYGGSSISQARFMPMWTLGPRKKEVVEGPQGPQGPQGPRGPPGEGGGAGGGEIRPIIIPIEGRYPYEIGEIAKGYQTSVELVKCMYDKLMENSAWFGNLRQDAERSMRHAERSYHRMLDEMKTIAGRPLTEGEESLIYEMTTSLYELNNQWSTVFNRDAEGFHGLGSPVNCKPKQAHTESYKI